MTWEMHEGGKQIDAPSRQLRTAAWPDRSNTCQMCSQYSSRFMQSAADATKQAALKPDDQIWFMVFSSLQEMLMHRTSCLERHTAELDSSLSGEHSLSRAQTPAVHVGPQRTTLKALTPTHKSALMDHAGIAVPKNAIPAVPSTTFWRSTALSWFGLRASPHPNSLSKTHAPAKKQGLSPGAGVR